MNKQNNNTNTKWHEEDVFWEMLAPRMFTDSRRAQAPSEVQRILALMNLATGARVLDLGCGAGLHAIEMVKQGCDVTGVDRTAAYLKQVSVLANQEELSMELVLDDMRSFQRSGAFDGIISLKSSFGYFEEPDEDILVLRNIKTSLKKDGVFFLDISGKEVLARGFPRRSWQELEDKSLLLEEHSVNGSWNRIDDHWILLKDGQRHEFRSGHRLYSASEITRLLKESGFGRVECFGDFSGAPYDQNAKRLVVVARP